MSDITNLFYDWVSAEEIGSAHKIEIEGDDGDLAAPNYSQSVFCTGFPPDEAASLETFKYFASSPYSSRP